MEKRHSSSRSTPVERALNDDPLGRQLHLNGVTPTRLVAGFEGAAFGSAIIPRPAPFAESLLTFPAYGLTGLALAAGTYAGVRMIDRKRAESAEQTQEEIRALLDEPVDVFTAGTKNNKEHTIRWYGADHESTDTASNTLARYRKIIDFAVEQNLDAISVDSAWASDLLPKSGSISAPPPMELFGAVRSGPSYISDVKASSSIITDHASPDMILTSTPEQAYDMLQMMERSAEHTLLADIIKRTGDQFLIAEYERVTSKEGASRTRLINHTRSRLEMMLNQETSGTVHARDEFGQPTRQRIHQHRRVQGEYVHQTSEALQGEESTRFEITNLLDIHNAKTLDDLIKKTHHSKATEQQQSQLVTAAYLLALRSDQRMTRMSFQQYQTGIKHRKDTATTFQTLVHEKKRLGWSSRSSLERTVRTMGIFGLTAVAALGLKGQMNVIGHSINSDREAWCTSEGINDQGEQLEAEDYQAQYDDCNDSYAQAKPIESMLYDVARARSYFEVDIAKGTLQLITDVVGHDMVDAIIPNASQTLNEEWRKRLDGNPDASAYTGASNSSGIGDVQGEGEGNQTVYSIQSLDGTPTGGYWYGNSFNRLGYSGGYGIGLSGGALTNGGSTNFTRPDNMQKSIDTLNQENALSVSTSLVRIDTAMQMPVLAGMEITALRVVDADHPERSYSPTRLEGDSTTDLKSVLLNDADVTAMVRAGINTPVLTYWLSKTSDGMSQDYYASAMMVEEPHTSREALKDIAETTREALGVPDDASVFDIASEIMAKDYGLAPIAEAEGFDTSAEDRIGVIKAWGEQLGSLDALNCNLASTAFILATADHNLQFNQATGFYDDGDGLLTQKEAHAWLVDSENIILDPTPSGISEFDRSPEEPEQQENSALSIPILPIATGLTIGIAGLTAWRRREDITRALETRKRASIEDNPLTGKALSIIEQALYGHPDETIDWTIKKNIEETNISDRIDLLPKLGKDDVRSLEATIFANASLTKSERQAVRKILLY